VLRYNAPLHRFAALTAFSTLLLLAAGGLVTSTGSSLAVPDWPLSFGQVFPKMEGGVLYEHGHRMIAAAVGLLTTVLMIWLLRAEPRAWVRKLGVAAFLAVLAQGLLGGITVLLKLPLLVSMGHACLGQGFFCITVALTLATSREWIQPAPPARREDAVPGLRALGVMTTVFIFLQLILGALVRHTGAGLSIPDFPLSFGRLVPPVLEGPILIAYLHRLGAVAVTFYIAWLVARIFISHPGESRLLRPALGLSALLVLQITLGGATVLMQLAVLPATAHVVTGAIVLATSLLITLRAFRLVARRDAAETAGAAAEAAPAVSPAGWAAR
jgi:cytochrome c oxidase assembly protein subunit 15